jgi:broad specificity phosphatase PhoE
MRLTYFRLALIGATWCESLQVLSIRRFSDQVSMTIKTSAYIYPLSQLTALRPKHKTVKTVHFIRHAEGYHNVNNQYRDIINLDARLTPKGVAQCEAFASERALPPHSVDLIVTSSMTRCIQTALLCFPDRNAPVLAHESIRETVNYACDRRRPLSQIRQEFPSVDFSNVEHEDDAIWNEYMARVGHNWDAHRESAELYRVADRGRTFLAWLSQRSEANIVVCTHSAFLRCILSWGHEGGVQSIMDQTLDDRQAPGPDVPVLGYCGDNNFERQMRADYDNCEMRSFAIVFDQE